MKKSGEVTTTVTTAIASAGQPQKKLTEVSACILIGTKISTGQPFYRTFPNQSALTQWLSAGDGHDIDVVRVEPITTFIS